MKTLLALCALCLEEHPPTEECAETCTGCGRALGPETTCTFCGFEEA
jgi:hypothetical protein